MQENTDEFMMQVGWVTQMKSTPPLTQEYIDRQYLRYKVMIDFLQGKGLTTRIVLEEGQEVNDDSRLMMHDLTYEGLEFYRKGIIPWIKKIDSSKNPEKVIRDVTFLEKKLQNISKDKT